MMFYAEARDENYLDVVEMMKNALLNVEFSADRAKSKLSQLLNRIPGLKVDLFSPQLRNQNDRPELHKWTDSLDQDAYKKV